MKPGPVLEPETKLAVELEVGSQSGGSDMHEYPVLGEEQSQSDPESCGCQRTGTHWFVTQVSRGLSPSLLPITEPSDSSH